MVCAYQYQGYTPPMPRRVMAEDYTRMVDLARQGVSINEISRQVGFSTATVSNYVRDAGVDTVAVQGGKADDARRAWDVRARTDLVAAGFNKAAQLLPEVDKTRDLQSWAVSVGILIDKMRLESDQSTANVESHVTYTVEQRDAVRRLLTGSD